MTDQQNNAKDDRGWEKRFNERFTNFWILGAINNDGETFEKRIKDFIRHELHAQRSCLLKEIEERLPKLKYPDSEKGCGCKDCAWVDGFNKCSEKVTLLLNELKEKKMSGGGGGPLHAELITKKIHVEGGAGGNEFREMEEK